MYLNNIIIYSKDKINYKKDIKKIFNYLKQFKLYTKLLKYIFKVDEIQFLSFVVNLSEINMKKNYIIIILK